MENKRKVSNLNFKNFSGMGPRFYSIAFISLHFYLKSERCHLPDSRARCSRSRRPSLGLRPREQRVLCGKLRGACVTHNVFNESISLSSLIKTKVTQSTVQPVPTRHRRHACIQMQTALSGNTRT